MIIYFLAHIFFDDAFEKNDKGHKTINEFVKELIGAIDKAASKVHDIDGMKMTPPIKTPTPYGGRLTWKLPGGNLLIVHLKDKKKVAKRKRWSMVRFIYVFCYVIRIFEIENLIFFNQFHSGHVHVLFAWLSTAWTV